MTEIKVYRFHKATADDVGSITSVDDYKAFIDDKRVGFVRVSTFHTEDMEGRISSTEVMQEKQIDSEEVEEAIYQTIVSESLGF